MYVLPNEDIAIKYIEGEYTQTGQSKWFNDNIKVGYAGKIYKTISTICRHQPGRRALLPDSAKAPVCYHGYMLPWLHDLRAGAGEWCDNFKKLHNT